MKRRLFQQSDVERILRGARQILATMGMKVESRDCLEAMERFGARIDWPAERAFLGAEVLDRMLELVKCEQRGWVPEFERRSAAYAIGGGGSCPFYYSEDIGDRRRATEEDCIEALRICETSGVVGCGPPVLDSSVGSRYEQIRCLELGIRTLSRTRCGGIDLFHVEQVPFAVELGELYADDPGFFLPAGNCPTSPLCVGKTIADLAVVKAAYPSKTYAVPVMPVMGANAPMTPVGTAVIGVAEILGGYVLAKSLNPETPVAASALCALMDMQTGNMVYCAPEVITADVAICETLEYCLALSCRAFGTYIDAKLPGMRAMREKLFRSLGSALYSQLNEFSGTLDQGKVFSPTQMILDKDLHELVAGHVCGQAVDDETLALDVIREIEWDSTGYLMHEHTVRHMRDAWRSAIFESAPWLSLAQEQAREARHLAAAHETWRENLKHYTPPEHGDDFLRTLDDISRRARTALQG